MNRLKGKIAVITGGNSGVGAATAKLFAAEGATVVITARREAALKEVADEITAAGGEVYAVSTDISKPEDPEMLMQKVMDKYGKIDILVNNAGITKDNLMLKMTEEDFEQVIDTNLKGAFLCIKHVSKIMLKQKRGHIINISSVVGVRGNAGQVNYASSKAGLIGMTKSVAKEIGSRGITVNAVAPGFIETDMTAKLPEAVVEENLKSIPMKKLGKVEDVANLVRFLASDDASYITGQVICVDGGMAM